MAEIKLDAGKVQLIGNLEIPGGATHIIIFVHGSGSSRFSPRNQAVAKTLNEGGLATLLFDLLSDSEEGMRFDIDLLTERLLAVTKFIQRYPKTKGLKISFFGASTGAAAAISAAAKLGNVVTKIVSRGGRPDLAGRALAQITCPILLIVGGDDEPVIEMNEEAMSQMHTEKRIEIIPGATHLFSETGALQQVAHIAQKFFLN